MLFLEITVHLKLTISLLLIFFYFFFLQLLSLPPLIHFLPSSSSFDFFLYEHIAFVTFVDFNVAISHFHGFFYLGNSHFSSPFLNFKAYTFFQFPFSFLFMVFPIRICYCPIVDRLQKLLHYFQASRMLVKKEAMPRAILYWVEL
ncbi:hypothetical protein RIF29_27965 [Crotalaria pallida]|uniref:Uncharacterized protein n=1 Tax=Crotalaria pallida TaxID=3830 RepID=A0AAN9ER26_CROPI